MSKAIFPSIPAHKGPGVYKITDETNGKVYIGSSQEDQSPHYGDYSTKWDKIKGEPQKRCECWIPARIADIFVLKLFEDGLSLDKFISDAIADYLGMDAISQTQQNTSITS